MSKNRVSTPPEWFILENYSNSRSFSCEKWSNALSLRAGIYHDTNEDKIFLESSAPYFEGVKQNPLFTPLEFQSKNYRELIHETTVIEAELIKHWYDSYQHGLKEKAGYQDEDKVFSDVTNFYNDTLCIPLNISLRASDETLIHEFKKLLTSLREKHKEDSRARNISPVLLKKLYSMRVLPILDLLIWEEIEQVVLKRSIFSEIIQASGSKELLDSYFPFARKCISHDFINNLLYFEIN